MKESNSLSSVEPCSNLVTLENPKVLIEQIEIDKEVVTDSHDDVVVSDSLMANTKQTARKSRNGQGSPARFPGGGGKPGGKAAKHMRARAEDDNNDSSSDGLSSGSENGQTPQPANQVQKTIRAGRCRRVWGGKARIYK